MTCVFLSLVILTTLQFACSDQIKCITVGKEKKCACFDGATARSEYKSEIRECRCSIDTTSHFRCREDGTFERIQCSSEGTSTWKTCRCVDRNTGNRLSLDVPFKERSSLICWLTYVLYERRVDALKWGWVWFEWVVSIWEGHFRQVREWMRLSESHLSHSSPSSKLMLAVNKPPRTSRAQSNSPPTHVFIPNGTSPRAR